MKTAIKWLRWRLWCFWHCVCPKHKIKKTSAWGDTYCERCLNEPIEKQEEFGKRLPEILREKFGESK